MTTWWIVFERRKGSKTWTPTTNGNDGGAFYASESDAKNEIYERDSWEGYVENWEHTTVKVEVAE